MPVTDMLFPSKADEAKKHKLKRLVQGPNSYFMDVKCPGCYNIQTVFSHVHCAPVYLQSHPTSATHTHPLTNTRTHMPTPPATHTHTHTPVATDCCSKAVGVTSKELGCPCPCPCPW